MGQSQSVFDVEAAFDLTATLAMLGMGPGDPCLQVTPRQTARLALTGDAGPMLIELQYRGRQLHADLRGPQAAEYTKTIPGLVGLDFVPPTLDQPQSLRQLAHRFAGFRLPRAPILFPSLVRIVLQQLVSFRDAAYGWRRLVRKHGERIAESPELYAPPRPSVLARLTTSQFVEVGILPEQGRRIRALARLSDRIEELWQRGEAADSRPRTIEWLRKLPGIGPWTLGFLQGVAMQDSNAVVVGDYSFPHQVAYFLERKRRSSDEEMLRILDRYEPHRFYVLALILKSGVRPPRRGPRSQPLRHRMGHR